MSKDSSEVMAGREILEELREQTKWLRFLGLRALGPVLEEQLTVDRERLAYELSDGRSSEAIAPLVGVSSRSILNWWAKWIAGGIASEIGRGRAQRLVSLTQLGIAVPASLSAKAHKEKSVPTATEGNDGEPAE